MHACAIRSGRLRLISPIQRLASVRACTISNAVRSVHGSAVILKPNLEEIRRDAASANKPLVFDNRGPNLMDFIQQSHQQRLSDISSVDVNHHHGHHHHGHHHGHSKAEADAEVHVPYLLRPDGRGRTYYVEVYGCQMNVNDTEIVMALMDAAGYERTHSSDNADILFLMTCAIRDNAEKRIWTRLQQFKSESRSSGKGGSSNVTVGKDRKVAVLGCMAERLKSKFLESKERLVDVVCGPDGYRTLPYLLDMSKEHPQGVANVLLSADETYSDVAPVRLQSDSVTAHLSVMRGCNNMCSYCIVPFTRGIERSRPIESIVQEAKRLADEGIKEITLLGQNVNSYRDTSDASDSFGIEGETTAGNSATATTATAAMSRGFKTIYKQKEGGRRFAELVDRVAEAVPNVRIRFTSPHPKDFPDELLYVIRDRPNVCRSIHMPSQSGSTSVLESMRRGYTREAYLELVSHIRNIIPDVTISTDMISGFCGETDQDHRDTITLMKQVEYDTAFMFAYSMREKTHAHRKLKDDVPEDVKQSRLREVIDTFHKVAKQKNARLIGSEQVVLIEGWSDRKQAHHGRTDGGLKMFITTDGSNKDMVIEKGMYIVAKVDSTTSSSLRGNAIRETSLTAL
ncbi:hypothetical protein GQ42DRAFT_162239 [Ramicandelaber brevisporus]|nr:hypothetical protein GQ42DRAFT_162239 [Ramicandelaber brevisporus]